MRAITLCCLLAVAAPDGGQAQASAPDGAELYRDYFGCWNCHGRRGEGGDGQPLRETYLPLSLFIKTLRLPAGEMPVFNDILATDVELAAVYDWLEGVDEVAVPPLVALVMEGPGAVAAGEETELAFTVVPSGTGADHDYQAVRFRYRLTLFRRDNTLVADQAFQYQPAGDAEWSAFQTDPFGQVLLGPSGGIEVADLPLGDGATARLRVSLAPGAYVLVVEAVDAEEPAEPAVLGVATAVIKVE